MIPAMQAVAVSKRFGATTALDTASLAVLPGEAHALVGRNGAGKSTLVAILTGLLQPDAGEARFAGQPAPAHGDRAAWSRSVACVYQHSMLVPGLSVAENVFLNRFPARRGTIAWKELRARTRAILDAWKIEIDENAAVGSLNVEERRMVEVVRALSFGARLVILDEPTAHLDSNAIKRLFAQLRTLKDAGVAMLFISHHLQEVYELCDSVTVLRDAKVVCTRAVKEFSRDSLVGAMTGEGEGDEGPAAREGARGPGAAVLKVQSLSVAGAHDVSLCVRSGEIAGLAGISGSGKVAVAEAIAGLRKRAAGTVLIGDAPVAPFDPRSAIRAGVGYVPRDRHRDGLVLDLSVAENATLTIDDRLGPAGTIEPRRRRAAADSLMRRLDIVASGSNQRVLELSGGNQQKVVLARALASDPKVLILVYPTAGVDVKSKEAILHDVESARERGTAILVVSDEIADLRSCDRVLVMSAGRIVADLAAGWSENDLVAKMEGFVAARAGA